MIEKSRSEVDFNKIVEEIEENKILLPDFQRDFVWSGKKEQTKLIASVLCRMPIGSILMLASKAGAFAAKKIGAKNNYVDIPDEIEVEFLLDGQQRTTVLTNVFSDIIHKRTETCRILSLKRRYFLKIPRETHSAYEKDYFGLNHFSFRLKNPNRDIPEFMTDEIDELIEVRDFNVRDEVFYNPKMIRDDASVIAGCTHESDFYLIPLYILTHNSQNETKNRRLLEKILGAITRNECDKVMDQYDNLNEKTEERKVLIEHYISDEATIEECMSDREIWKEEIEALAANWESNFKAYLYGCIERMDIHIMEAPNSSRAKAIEVFENLNKGGVSLSTFDLVMARVAKENRYFAKDLVQQVEQSGEYYMEGVPEAVSGSCKKYMDNKKKYSAGVDLEYINGNGELNKIFKEAFLNVLSLVINNREYSSEKKKNSCLSKEAILKLNAKDIDRYYTYACQGLDRAAFFLKSRCGVRSVTEINYKFILNILGFIFSNKEWYEDLEKQKLLEAWYWCAIFSGHYDKDQNAVMLQDLCQLLGIMNGNHTLEWLKALKDKVLDMQDFSDKDFLLYKNFENTKNAPKELLGKYICQFYLSRTYSDMFDEKMKISVFLSSEVKLEKHHIIPLGSAENIKESTKRLRKEKSIYNSPLNFIFITEDANKKIAAKSVHDYVNDILGAAALDLDFNIEGYQDYARNKEGAERILSHRYIKLQTKIRKRIDGLLEGWD